MSSRTVTARIADGTFSRSTEEWNDGRPGTIACALMSRGRSSRRDYCSDRRWRCQIRVGVAAGREIRGRTLWHKTRYYGRCRRSGTTSIHRRHNPCRRGHYSRPIAEQTVRNAGSAGRQDYRTIADLSDRRYETIFTYTICHTATGTTRYKTNCITIATAVRMYTIGAAVGAILLLLCGVGRRYNRDFTAQSV